MLATFIEHESVTRSYCRQFPILLERALGSHLYSTDGTRYLDFLSGAGALNYGHNNPKLKQALIDYLVKDGIVQSLDMHTVAKREFIDAFSHRVLAPRKLDYKLQFTGPTGATVVESAVKLARKVTGRTNVLAFTNAFHGMTGVALSLTANRHYRQRFAVPGVTRVPYDGYFGSDVNTISYLRRLLEDTGSGIDLPAAVILETVQAEGGVIVASNTWLAALRELTREFDIPLIVDDIQAGCGRSGSFFSFERAGIKPDFVCLSKSLSGIGVPLSLLLTRPEYDQWAPGEDNGTFRGSNLAFVAGKVAIDDYWADCPIETRTQQRSVEAFAALRSLAAKYPDLIREVRGVGLIQGVEFVQPEMARKVAAECFSRGLVIETSGARSQVLKLLPPLTISGEELADGLGIIETAVTTCADRNASVRVARAVRETDHLRESRLDADR